MFPLVHNGYIGVIGGWLACVCSMSSRDRLQQQLRRDPQFLQEFYRKSQMRMNSWLQNHGVAMVIDKQSLKLSFIFIVHQQCTARDTVSVCLSVCLSFPRWYHLKTTEQIIKQRMRDGSLGTLVFLHQSIGSSFRGLPQPSGGDKYWRFSNNISLYLRSGTR